ncbi:MAG: T9SS type A sorting domain-containing protein, partial [Bacteroidia bacterium]|nr:T9SS type A sorting domain-containing protein [Bacteroidia bacterium]
GQQNGLIQLGTQGGSPPYSINWSNGDSSFLITGLQAGAYHATIADAEGCRDEFFDIEITEPDELLIDLRNIKHLTCPDGLDSYIDISVSGGVAPYFYFWSDRSFTEDLNNRPAGSYSITVTDYNACTESLNDIQVNAPQAIQTSLDSINHVNCAGSRNGYLSVSASGGSPPYLYNWSTEDGNFSSDQLLDSLLPGDYALTVVDNFGCKSGTEIFEIINFDKEINIFLDQLDPVLCFSDTTASIIAVGNDGAVPLDFNWSTGEKEIKEIVADTIYNIGAGKYNLTITDNEGCVGISDSIVVVQPEELVFKLDTIVDLLCSGDSTGEISLLIEGGVPPYEVLWNNGMSGSEIKDLHEGYYKALIEDSNGCLLETQELPVHSPDPLEISMVLRQANSNQGGSISIVTQGGIAPYMYTWDSPLNFLTDSVAADLDPGEYFFNVVDANGCRIDSMATIDLLDSVSDEGQFGSINVFPVPSSNSLTIEYNDLNIKSIEVLNIAGQLILDLIDIPDDRLVLNIENLDTGAYFLIINSQDSRIVRKFLVF